jgi:hypothetical protein
MPDEPYWVGFGGDGRGFFCCDAQEQMQATNDSSAAQIFPERGNLSEAQMEVEFKDLVAEDWAWKVKQLSAIDYQLNFPSKESLKMAIKGGGLTLPSSKCKVLVMEPVSMPVATKHLLETKVHLLGVLLLTARSTR